MAPYFDAAAPRELEVVKVRLNEEGLSSVNEIVTHTIPYKVKDDPF